MVDFLLAHFWASSNLIHCSFCVNDFLFHLNLHFGLINFYLYLQFVAFYRNFISFCFMILWTVHNALTNNVSDFVFSGSFTQFFSDSVNVHFPVFFVALSQCTNRTTTLVTVIALKSLTFTQ